MMAWRCWLLPWHRILRGSFWASERVEVIQCSCGRRYAMHHGMQALIPYDGETEAFYRQLGTLGGGR